VEFKGQLIPAYRFLNFSKKVTKVNYTGEVLYNVLLANYGRVVVNNLLCETLHPDNQVAQLYSTTFKKGRTKTQPFVGEASEKRLHQNTTF
jgi:ornithine carbamoyltransferase